MTTVLCLLFDQSMCATSNLYNNILLIKSTNQFLQRIKQL